MSETVPQRATIVPDKRRHEFLPALFGKLLRGTGENTVYDMIGRLSPGYEGGFWNFYEFEGKPLFMAPSSDSRFRIACPNGFKAEVSAETVGIIATLYAFFYLSLGYADAILKEGYDRLIDYSDKLPEAVEISKAVED